MLINNNIKNNDYNKWLLIIISKIMYTYKLINVNIKKIMLTKNTYIKNNA